MDINEKIKTKLVINIAELSLDKAMLEAELETLQDENNQLRAELEHLRANQTEETNESVESNR